MVTELLETPFESVVQQMIWKVALSIAFVLIGYILCRKRGRLHRLMSLLLKDKQLSAAERNTIKPE